MGQPMLETQVGLVGTLSRIGATVRARVTEDRGIGGLGFVLIAGAVVVAVLLLVAAYNAVITSETEKIQVG